MYLLGIIQVDEAELCVLLLAGSNRDKLGRVIAKRVIGGKARRAGRWATWAAFFTIRGQPSGFIDIVGVDGKRRLRPRVKDEGNQRCEAGRTFNQDRGRLYFADEPADVPGAGR